MKYQSPLLRQIANQLCFQPHPRIHTQVDNYNHPPQLKRLARTLVDHQALHQRLSGNLQHPPFHQQGCLDIDLHRSSHHHHRRPVVIVHNNYSIHRFSSRGVWTFYIVHHTITIIVQLRLCTTYSIHRFTSRGVWTLICIVHHTITIVVQLRVAATIDVHRFACGCVLAISIAISIQLCN